MRHADNYKGRAVFDSTQLKGTSEHAFVVLPAKTGHLI